MNKKIYLSIFLIGLVTFLISLNFIENKLKTNQTNLVSINYINADNVLDDSSMEEIVGFADYVFIAQVDEIIGNFYDETVDMMPYTKYKLSITKNYKGNLQSSIIIAKNGGYDSNGVLNLLKDGETVEELLEVGKKYLLFACAQSDGSILILSFGGTYLLSENNKNIKISNQEINIQNIVDNQKEYKRKRYNSIYEI